MTATWHTDRSRAALPTRLPQPAAPRLLPLWDTAPLLPAAWLGTLAPRQALNRPVADVAAAVFAGRDAPRLVSVPPCGLAARQRRQRAGRGPTAAPDTLLGGLLQPAVWFLALVGVLGASVLVVLLAALAPTIETTVQLAELGTAALTGGR